MKWNPFRGAHGSRLYIRIAAVAVLVIGLGAGIVIGLHKQPVDTLSVGVQPEAAKAQTQTTSDQTPQADTDIPQAQPAGAALEQARQDSTVVQQAQDKAVTKAKEATQQAVDRSKAAADAAKKREEQSAAAADQGGSSSSGTSGEDAPSAPVDCQSYSGNRQVGCSLLSTAGFGTDQMSCLDKLWSKESGWNVHASNGSSGAYGIPQALPGDKMASYGDDWQTNPVPQIKWGLNYIKGRYDTPCGAWSHSQATDWY